MKKTHGYFLTFEGPEGSGKSTQIRLAEDYLLNCGHKVLILREPGGTEVSEAIRRILLHNRFKDMSAETELLLYLAARSEIVRKKIRPALERGMVVICDRFEDSTMAYQGYGRELPLVLIQQISRFVREDCVPDRTILLDIAPHKGLKRGGRIDRIELQSMDFHRRVRKGFLALARKQKNRFIVLNALQDRETIAQIIRERLNRDLGKGF